MKRLILDYYRRWARVLALVAVLEFGLGWFIASAPKLPSEFWGFVLALWASSTRLAVDLRDGALRPIAVLPLTGRQIGRSWWLASVPIPAIALTALLFSGAATSCHFHPTRGFPAGQLIMMSLFTLAWQGITFTTIFNATRGFGENWREIICNWVISVLSLLQFFGGMVFCLGATNSHWKAALILGFGGFLTVVGWVRAEHFEPGRAWRYLGRIELPNLRRHRMLLTPLKPNILPGQHKAPGGYGGISFLLSTTFIRALLYLAAMAALIVPAWRWQRTQEIAIPSNFPIFATTGIFMSSWFIIFYLFMSLLPHLRALRTLPVSATRLAAVMLALVILPLTALGALATTVAWHSLGSPTAVALLNSFAFNLASVAFCVFFAIWRGAGIQAYVLLLLSLFSFHLGRLWLQLRFHQPEFPLGLTAAIVAVSVLLAFVLTRWALLHSTRAYRVQADTSVSFLMANR